jgi:bile acid:Na+ symporter, BASS family
MGFFEIHPIDLMIGGVLALVMLGIGLSLSIHDVRSVVVRPRSLLTGLGIQMIGAPLLAILIVSFFEMPVFFKIGFIILSTCPGGTTSSFVVYLFRSNVALSLTLTTINSILSLFSIPILVNGALYFYLHKSTNIHLPFLQSILQIFLVTIIPASLGIFIRAQRPRFAERVRVPTKYIMLTLLAIVFIVKFFADEDQGGTGINMNDIWIIIPAGLIFHFASFFLTYYLGRVAKLNSNDSLAISIEVSLHNTTLAFLVAGTLLQNEDMVKPALIYSLFSFVLTLLYSFIYRNKAQTLQL